MSFEPPPGGLGHVCGACGSLLLDAIPPKKRDRIVHNDLYEKQNDDFEDDDLDYDTDAIPLAEF